MTAKVPIPDRLTALPAYIPGASPPPGRRAYKLSSNESPIPPLPGVLAAVADAAAELNRYPDMYCAELTQVLATHLGVEPDQLVIGNGSEALLEHILHSLTNPGDEVVYAWRSFEAYPIAVQLAGAKSVKVPLTPTARHDLPGMVAAMTSATRAVLLCSPNNPTGPAITATELTDFLDQVPSQVLVILDQAYLEFVNPIGAPDAVAHLERYPNLLLLRTFSKAYGMAGLRCGYAIGRRRLITPLKQALTPFSVNLPAQRAALVALEHQTEMKARVAMISAERDRMANALRAQGWDIPPTEANFVWVPAGVNAIPLAQAAASAGVLVRPFDGDGVRVTAGEAEGIDAFLAVAASWV